MSFSKLKSHVHLFGVEQLLHNFSLLHRAVHTFLGINETENIFPTFYPKS